MSGWTPLRVNIFHLTQVNSIYLMSWRGHVKPAVTFRVGGVYHHGENLATLNAMYQCSWFTKCFYLLLYFNEQVSFSVNYEMSQSEAQIQTDVSHIPPSLCQFSSLLTSVKRQNITVNNVSYSRLRWVCWVGWQFYGPFLRLLAGRGVLEVL